MTDNLIEQLKEQNIQIEFDLKHVYTILAGLILLTQIDVDPHNRYIYSKLFMSIQLRIHHMNLCKTPKNQCNFEQSYKNFQEDFKDEISNDFNRLLKLY